ncbi:SPOR domain-containing protein [Rhodocytophaga aerolata]|uniref:SPOR domain-containing protein n=1 Tax=Rhodocytophaga aerolata TaxID=455078 RepID=A0ABT8RCZ6_9BACT|nr:SPOR domain-containing protein [Rhodocytophaga aerolata]MDO1449977.1 SPOR domain-containing protein [Rhodocytophaga aerolata]
MDFKQLKKITCILLFATIWILQNACTPKGIATKGKGKKDAQYTENLADFRPTYKVEDEENKSSTNTPTASQSTSKPANDVTAKVDAAMEQIAVTNKSVRYAQGYRIQIYSGNSRDEANNARNRSYALFPEITPHIVYNQPTFRVKVGDFVDRLDAQRVYAGLLTDFPNAMVVQDRVEIR